MNTSLSNIGPHLDIVMSSRVRIARNLERFPFPHRMAKENSRNMMQLVREAVAAFPPEQNSHFEFIELNHLTAVEQQIYVEEHLISPALLSNPDNSGFFIDKARERIIMVNEEDHIRIQCMLKGLQLEEAWKRADLMDDWLSRQLPYAFDETFGYLTACPTNLGTGVRFSVMLHLPALTMMGYISGLIHAAGQLGFAVRGVFGEGSDYMGNIYQISNQMTLGLQERELIGNLDDIILQVIQKERMARKNLLMHQKEEVEDRIFRSLGILKYARRLTRKEAMQHLSDLKLGVTLGMIESCSLAELQQLIEFIQPANLQKQCGEEMEEAKRDRRRAAAIREKLARGGVTDVHE